jgi:hypothetical protein
VSNYFSNDPSSPWTGNTGIKDMMARIAAFSGQNGIPPSALPVGGGRTPQPAPQTPMSLGPYPVPIPGQAENVSADNPHGTGPAMNYGPPGPATTLPPAPVLPRPAVAAPTADGGGTFPPANVVPEGSAFPPGAPGGGTFPPGPGGQPAPSVGAPVVANTPYPPIRPTVTTRPGKPAKADQSAFTLIKAPNQDVVGGGRGGSLGSGGAQRMMSALDLSRFFGNVPNP